MKEVTNNDTNDSLSDHNYRLYVSFLQKTSNNRAEGNSPCCCSDREKRNPRSRWCAQHCNLNSEASSARAVGCVAVGGAAVLLYRSSGERARRLRAFSFAGSRKIKLK